MTDACTISLTFEPAEDAQLPEVLGTIASTVEEACGRQDWGPELTFRVNLVLEELVTNILSYGAESCGPTPAIDVRVTSDDRLLTIKVSDDGKSFDPLRDAPRPPSYQSSDSQLRIGGLGIHLVRNLMDSVSYCYANGRNHLTMTALRPQ